MSRTMIQVLALMVSLASTVYGSAGPGTAGAEKPNILWIVTEDIGCDMACYGAKGVHTPVLDQLSAEGFLTAASE